MGLVFLSIQLLPCVLVGAFKPFTFKVIIDRYVFSDILLLDYFPLYFFLSLFLLLLLLNASHLMLVAVRLGVNKCL